jgi:uncharacterized FAD-dependent dehydrogenase
LKIVIIGCGSSGIACAITLIKNGIKGEDITIIEKGHLIDKRKCFVTSDTPCKKCKICSIVHGCGGSGSFSDSKLNWDITGRIGGDMSELMTQDEIKEYLIKTYDMYKDFGIEEFDCETCGMDYSDDAQEIVDLIKNNPKLDIGECATTHLGSERSRIIYKRMLDYLIDNNVHILSNMEVENVDTVNKKVCIKSGYISYDKLVVAMGRSGNKLVKEICSSNDIKYRNGKVDMGVRVECPNEVMKKLNDNFYECKIYYQGTFGDKARMFCTNPGGYVTVESYENNGKKLFTANGHAFAEKKSDNTNFAILVTRNFNEDCPNPLENYVFTITQAMNSLGKGSVILQSLKDIKLNRRSTEERIKELNIVPTANVYKGDITSVLPYRTLVTILEFIEELDKVVPGINGEDTLLYSMEVKLHSNKVLINKYGKSSNDNIYFIGDCSGWVRGLTTACSHGILCAEDILKNIK